MHRGPVRKDDSGARGRKGGKLGLGSCGAQKEVPNRAK